eukprot:6196872-Pleurochrysis_carterae.AAC.1
MAWATPQSSGARSPLRSSDTDTAARQQRARPEPSDSTHTHTHTQTHSLAAAAPTLKAVENHSVSILLTRSTSNRKSMFMRSFLRLASAQNAISKGVPATVGSEGLLSRARTACAVVRSFTGSCVHGPSCYSNGRANVSRMVHGHVPQVRYACSIPPDSRPTVLLQASGPHTPGFVQVNWNYTACSPSAPKVRPRLTLRSRRLVAILPCSQSEQIERCAWYAPLHSLLNLSLLNGLLSSFDCKALSIISAAIYATQPYPLLSKQTMVVVWAMMTMMMMMMIVTCSHSLTPSLSLSHTHSPPPSLTRPFPPLSLRLKSQPLLCTDALRDGLCAQGERHGHKEGWEQHAANAACV